VSGSRGTLLSGPQSQPLLVAAAAAGTGVSVLLFAALIATGEKTIVADIGPAGPYIDLHHEVTLGLMRLGCWFATLAGAGGVLAGLAAVRRGWRPNPRLVLAACVAATVLYVMVAPAASVDVQNYAEYGRMVVLGHNPYVFTPEDLYNLGDPVGLLRPGPWQDQPTVYGPVATAMEAAAAWLGGASMAWITFWIKVVNGICYIAVALVLGRLAGPDPARRARVAVLWTLNPLMLFWMVAGAHADLLAVLPLLVALWLARAAWRWQSQVRAGWAAALAGALAGAAIAVKVTFAAPVAGLAVAVWRRYPDGRREPMLAAGAAGGLLVLAVGYLIVGGHALSSLTQRLSSKGDAFLPLPGTVFDHAALYSVVTVAFVVLVGGLLAWRMPAGFGELPEVRPILICALAVVLGGIVQYPWYDAMFFPLLALFPASSLDAWLVGRITLISCVILPAVPIRGDQYRDARVVVPVFTIAFLVALAAGKLRAAKPVPVAG
jgi:hypothetical protein